MSRSMPKKLRFATVPISAILHLAHQAERDGSSTGATRAAILSICLNRELMLTRELILSRAGYHVCSVLNLEKAIHECTQKKFDLVVIGHSLLADRNALEFFCQAVSGSTPGASSSEEIRKRARTAILSLRRPGDPRLASADYELDPFLGPEALLELVNRILKPRH